MAQQMINEERNKAIDEFVQIFKSRTTSKAHEHIMRRFMKKE